MPIDPRIYKEILKIVIVAIIQRILGRYKPPKI